MEYQTGTKVVKKSLGKVRTFVRNSRKLRKVIAIEKLNKPFLSKKHMSLTTRGQEKVPHTKNSYSRLILCNQLIEYFIFLVSL